MPRTIILSLAPPSRDSYGSSEHWSVTENGRICDGLCWDEMLGTVARVTLDGPETNRYPMLSVDDHKAFAEKRALRSATPSRLEDALRQLIDALAGKETAGPVPDAVNEARAAIAAVDAKRDDEAVPF